MLNPVDGFPVGKHPTVIQFLEAVFHVDPLKPKYCSIWDVSHVVCYITSLPFNEYLTPNELSDLLSWGGFFPRKSTETFCPRRRY